MALLVQDLLIAIAATVHQIPVVIQFAVAKAVQDNTVVVVVIVTPWSEIIAIVMGMVALLQQYLVAHLKLLIVETAAVLHINNSQSFSHRTSFLTF